MEEKNKILIIGVDVEVHQQVVNEFSDYENFIFTTLKSGKEGLEKVKNNMYD